MEVCLIYVLIFAGTKYFTKRIPLLASIRNTANQFFFGFSKETKIWIDAFKRSLSLFYNFSCGFLLYVCFLSCFVAHFSNQTIHKYSDTISNTHWHTHTLTHKYVIYLWIIQPPKLLPRCMPFQWQIAIYHELTKIDKIFLSDFFTKEHKNHSSFVTQNEQCGWLESWTNKYNLYMYMYMCV